MSIPPGTLCCWIWRHLGLRLEPCYYIFQMTLKGVHFGMWRTGRSCAHFSHDTKMIRIVYMENIGIIMKYNSKIQQGRIKWEYLQMENIPIWFYLAEFNYLYFTKKIAFWHVQGVKEVEIVCVIFDMTLRGVIKYIFNSVS